MKFNIALEMGVQLSSITHTDRTHITYTRTRVIFTMILKEEYGSTLIHSVIPHHSRSLPSTFALHIDDMQDAFESYQVYMDETKEITKRIH